MIKSLIRLSLFLTISLQIAQYVIGSFSFGFVTSMLLYVMAMTVLYFMMRPLLMLISLPNEGPGYLFMSFILTVITSYILTIFIPMFSFRATTISELNIFGFVLPSKSLSAVWSLVFSALLISVLMFFFNWVCDSGKR